MATKLENHPWLRIDIADAIVEGFTAAGVRAHSKNEVSRTLVHVEGHDEPIVVLGPGSAGNRHDPDVILPDSLKAAAPGIRLDVQAILAGRELDRAGLAPA